MIKRSGLNFPELPDEKFDPMFGIASGAADTFGASGGVMEAALRTVAALLAGEENVPTTVNVRINSLSGKDKSLVSMRVSSYAHVGIKENRFKNNLTYSVASTGSVKEIKMPFTDVAAPKKFYFEPVYWAYYSGITTGTSKTTFSPDDDCIRAQIVTFIWRTMGEPEPSDSSAGAYFDDLKPGAYYVKAVNWAYETGITTGTSERVFGVNETCNRAMCVTFLYRAAGSPAVQYTNSFKDVKKNSYYYNAVCWADGTGLTTGVSPTSFDPNGIVNRGQCVTFLFRYAKSY